MLDLERKVTEPLINLKCYHGICSKKAEHRGVHVIDPIKEIHIRRLTGHAIHDEHVGRRQTESGGHSGWHSKLEQRSTSGKQEIEESKLASDPDSSIYGNMSLSDPNLKDKLHTPI